MPDSTAVLTALRDELVARGLVRKPSDAGAQSAPPTNGLPPCHVEPNAPPAPGEREAPEDDASLVVTIRLSSELGEEAFAYRRRMVIDVIYRSLGTGALKRARALDAQIRSALVDGRPDYGLGWTMGTTSPVDVLQSSVYGGLGPVSRDPAQGATDTAKYAFEVKT